MNLLDNQISCVEKLNRYKVGALFMEAGTGKTITACELISSVEDIDYILWLTPFQTKNNLKEELIKWSIIDIDIIDIVGIETLSSSDKTYLNLINKLERSKKPFIICDESLKIKNIKAIRTKRIIELGKKAEYKLILNGTPLSKSLEDIYPQMMFLSEKILNMTYQQYINTFCEYTEIKKVINGITYKKNIITGYANVRHLYKLIGFYVYECDLSLDVNSFVIPIYHDLEDDLIDKYKSIKERYLKYETLMMYNNNIFLRMVQELQNSYSRSLFKINKIRDIVDDKTIIFCKYIETKNMVMNTFKNARVLTYGKHSYGLNLQNYNKIIFFDKTFDYALRTQAMRRIYRTGQVDDCYYYEPYSSIGLDRMMDLNIEKKQSLLEYFKQKGREIFKEL